ncbi:MAG: translation initiation factor IF-5A [Nanoarchaeota archaeon]
MSTKPISVGSLRPGRYIVVDGVACMVKQVQISKPGKHGGTKARIDAVGVLDNIKRVIIKPTGDSIESPLIEKENAQVLSITGETANIMDMKTYETFDLKIPEELQGKLKEGAQIQYWIVLGQKVMQTIRSQEEDKDDE